MGSDLDIKKIITERKYDPQLGIWSLLNVGLNSAPHLLALRRSHHTASHVNSPGLCLLICKLNKNSITSQDCYKYEIGDVCKIVCTMPVASNSLRLQAREYWSR